MPCNGWRFQLRVRANKVEDYDQIEAHADWSSHTLHTSNPTSYPAAIRILQSTGATRDCVLAPGVHRASQFDLRLVVLWAA